MKKKEYKNNILFAYEDRDLEIGKKFLEKEYRVLKTLKDTKRNYVAVVEISGKKYVVKEPRNEYRIPQRKIMSYFKKGEALTTLENVNSLLEKGFNEFVKPYVAIVKRKKGFIEYSALIMEYYDGVIDQEYNKNFVEMVKKMHEFGVYHGDFNPGNFLVKDGEIKILDTQAKKIDFFHLRKHYDMITMKNDSYDDMVYPYDKNLSYYIALAQKKFKRLKIVESIKLQKKKLRDKGWKI